MVSIDTIPIKNLTLLERNPRKICKDQFEKLCNSLKKDPNFFFNRPCLVHNKENKLVVYAGNQRILAAKKLGWENVPCIVESDLSEDIIKERIIKDNKHYGEFDFDILANEWNIDVLLGCGFTADEIVGSVQDIDTESSEIKEDDLEECCDKCGQKIKKK